MDQRTLKTLAMALSLATLPIITPATAQRAPENAAPIVATNAGHTFKLLVPPGECVLDRTHPIDGRVVTTTERLLGATNTLNLVTANCKTRENWRKGRTKYLTDYTQVQSYNEPETKSHAGKERQILKAGCTAMRQYGDNIAAGVSDEMDRRLKAGREKIKLAGNAFLGVLAEDENACYLGLLVRLIPEGQTKEIERLVVYAHVILSGRIVYLYRFSGDVSPANLERLIADRKAVAAAHVSLNGGYGSAL